MNKTDHFRIMPFFAATLGLLLLTNMAGGVAEAIGAETVLVPNIVGMTSEQANNSLKSAGLVPAWKPSPEDTATDDPKLWGKISGQSPKPNTKVAKGSTVKMLFYVKPTIRVPNVIGMTAEQANNSLKSAGLVPAWKPSPEDTVTEDRKLWGKVSGQSPKPDAKASKGGTIRLLYYVAPKKQSPDEPKKKSPDQSSRVEVPKVVGLTAKEASEKLLALGLKYEVHYRETKDAAIHSKVYKQVPFPGDKADKGKIVFLYAYEHKKPAASAVVPNVVGMDDDTASRTLVKAGFSYKHETSPSGDPATFGKISRQSPAAGTSAPKGTKVTIWVNKAGDTVTVPNVLNMSLQAAETALSKAKLLPRLVSPGVPTKEAAKVDKVAQQTPAAGQSVPPKTRVEIKLYTADNVRVPNLVLKVEKEAVAAITKAGLSPVVLKTKVPAGSVRIGKVARQEPAQDAMAPRGSKVTIWIGEQ